MEDVVSSAAPNPAFWSGRRVLLTGHNGFKGAWAALWLKELGAEVHGLALPPETTPSLWREIGDGLLVGESIVDLVDRESVRRAVADARPQVVLHMAAQALVRRSYAEPVETIATNALGTIHLLDALRSAKGLVATLVVTTDKVYENPGSGRAFAEGDPLGGHDPYSASKAAAELLTRSYAASFFDRAGIPLATARAGNVVGGGDWSEDRLIPDIWRASKAGVPLRLRSPSATRPWQHVIEPLAGYFAYLEALHRSDSVPRALNFGPQPGEPMTVATVADAVSKALGVERAWQLDKGDHPPEMLSLSLDPALARETIGWRPRLSGQETIEWTARWYADHDRGIPARTLCLDQIRQYGALS